MRVLLIIGIVFVCLEIIADIAHIIDNEGSNILLHLFYLAVFIVGLCVL